MSFSVMVFSGYMPSSGIVESYGSFIPVYVFYTYSLIINSTGYLHRE